MSRSVRGGVLSAGILLAAAGAASAQNSAPGAGGQGEGWTVAVYPVLAWVPVNIGIDVHVPPIDGGGDDGGEVIDTNLDGAFFSGVSMSHGAWRVDANFMWASVGGDRPARPQMSVDADIVYFHASGGLRIYKDLSVTAGVRRVALSYDVKLGDLPTFTRKPGVWDPLVGLGWHRVGNKLEFHGTFEAGGFGVGADADIGASFRVDWKPVRHFGLCAGYGYLYLKVSDTRAGKTFTVKQSLHGPVAGIGLYF